MFHYCATPPCHKISLFKRPFRGSRSERLDHAFVLLVSLIFLYPQEILISVICMVIDIALLCPSSHTWFQEFSVINPSALLQDLHHALIRFLKSLLVCAVLYVITFTPLFISSPECVHLSPSTCKLVFTFLHPILCCPSPYCIPHAIIKCGMTILISYFPCLAARFSPDEDCSIYSLAALFAYLRIWDSLIRKNVGSLIRWFSSMRFHFDQEGCCPCCNSLS